MLNHISKFVLFNFYKKDIEKRSILDPSFSRFFETFLYLRGFNSQKHFKILILPSLWPACPYSVSILNLFKFSDICGGKTAKTSVK